MGDSKGLNLRYIVFVAMVAGVGGFLFGYDTAVISGAVGYLKTFFHLSDVQVGWAGASALYGCIPGAMFAGFLSDRFGRRGMLTLCAALYTVSGILSAIPNQFEIFLAARLIGGLGIGASSMICPVYIAELSPEKIRGRLGSLFQLGIVVGIFLVFFVNQQIQKGGTEAWNTTTGWRWMLGSEALPALIFMALILLVPESPRWLMLKKRELDARSVLGRLGDQAYVDKEFDQIAAAVEEDGKEVGDVFQKANLRPLMIAVGLMAFSQFSGINAIMYYAPEIFKASGDAAGAAFRSSVYVGLINLLFTLVAVAFIDRAGRRTLLLIGVLVQTIALFLVGVMFASHINGLPLLGCILLYVAAFAMAMGPIPWIVASEIFPSNVRARAMSVATFTIWASATVVAQTFPVLNERLGGATTFWVFGGCSLVSLVFIAARVPETKGRTLEQIQQIWKVS